MGEWKYDNIPADETVDETQNKHLCKKLQILEKCSQLFIVGLVMRT